MSSSAIVDVLFDRLCCTETFGCGMSVALTASSAVIASFDDDDLVLEFYGPGAMSDSDVSGDLAAIPEHFFTVLASRASGNSRSCG